MAPSTNYGSLLSPFLFLLHFVFPSFSLSLSLSLSEWSSGHFPPAPRAECTHSHSEKSFDDDRALEDTMRGENVGRNSVRMGTMVG